MGRQFANDSMTPEAISVSRDSYQGEIPSDRTSHGDATPGHSNGMYSGRHYANDVKGGTSVSGKSSATTIGVNPHDNKRGEEN
jgi:hypothetical protein